jgi:hypothetical protein
MIIAITCVIAILVIVFVLGVRPKDLPEPEPVSPFRHLDERKAAIYENLRDLQFEYRVGKLSDVDYQQTKQDLQKELASVMAEVDRLKEELKGQPALAAAAPKTRAKLESDPRTCPHCNARFDRELKFCGECGKPMKAVKV